MQKELACRNEKGRKNEECEEKVTATHRSTNSFDVFIFPYVPPSYHHYPVAELQALKVDPDLNCSPPRRPTAPPARPPALPASNTDSTATTGSGSWRARRRKRPRNDSRNPQRRGRRGKDSQTSPIKEKKDKKHRKGRKWEDYRRVSSSWTDETNTNYCTPVAELAEAIKEAFPACVWTHQRLAIAARSERGPFRTIVIDCMTPSTNTAAWKSPTTEETNLAVSRLRDYSASGYQQMRGGRRKGQGGRPLSWTERNPEQRGCAICGTDDHVTRKCRLCKNDGHWARECPENQKTKKKKIKQTEARKTESREEQSATVQRKEGRVLKYAFTCSPACPVPFMGRDLMCKLNLVLVADCCGVRVTEQEEKLCCLRAEPQWAYEWRI
ncbi:Gag-Pol polyprotein [Labeo rohita]|uniref:Gag-Pol polyprotein n=1 Tax=Labeo rohita TaxID=84645 RepID=A0ABQ8LCX3_LABRO|nr:Gag-Pol polyprotein [Labeo rohita]